MSRTSPIGIATSYLPSVITNNPVPIGVALVAIGVVATLRYCRSTKPITERQVAPPPAKPQPPLHADPTCILRPNGEPSNLHGIECDLLMFNDLIYQDTYDFLLAIVDRKSATIDDLIAVANDRFLKEPENPTKPHWSLLKLVFYANRSILTLSDVASLILGALKENRECAINNLGISDEEPIKVYSRAAKGPAYIPDPEAFPEIFKDSYNPERIKRFQQLIHSVQNQYPQNERKDNE